MKKLSYSITFLLICTLSGFGQNALTEESIFSTPSTEQERLNILTTAFITQPNTSRAAFDASSINNNHILIQQIGVGNTTNIQTRAQASQITATQNGNFNALDLNINAPEVNSTFIQNGDNNAVLDNIYYSNLPVELNVLQNGTNLTVNRIGTNSLTNRMQLVQQGNNRTITIISN